VGDGRTFVCGAWPETGARWAPVPAQKKKQKQPATNTGFFLAARVNFTSALTSGWRAMFLAGLRTVIPVRLHVFKVKEHGALAEGSRRGCANQSVACGFFPAAKRPQHDRQWPFDSFDCWPVGGDSLEHSHHHSWRRGWHGISSIAARMASRATAMLSVGTIWGCLVGRSM